jgi:hypothetical protein
MEYEFSIHDMAPQPIVSIRAQRATAEIPAFMGRTFGTLFSRLGELGIPAAGPDPEDPRPRAGRR